MALVRERTIPTERPPLVGESLVPIFGEYRGVAWSARQIPTAVISVLVKGAATFYSKQLLNCTHEAEWTPFQTNYFSENLPAPGMEPGPLDV
jgi:hypothetical protein